MREHRASMKLSVIHSLGRLLLAFFLAAPMLSRAAGKPYGYHVVDNDYGAVASKLADGFGFVIFSTDSLFLGATARTQMGRRNPKGE